MANRKTHKFKTEVQQLLNLIIHSLYSNKEIFLRELISNASDALDKLRFRSQTEPAILGDDSDLNIQIIPDPEANTLEIRDNGIGMTYQEVRDNIGTIAHSGSVEFLKLMQKAEQPVATELIGQFGVGFYSAFMVADKVTLITRPPDSSTATRWESVGDGSYSIEETEKDSRGTSVILHLKDAGTNGQDFTQEWVIRSIIKKHSDFINYPITMAVERAETAMDKEGKPVEILDKNGKPAVQTRKTRQEETLNSMKALWVKPKSEVTEEEYNEFYTHLTHDPEPPLARLHVKMEGVTEYFALLYIPSKPPFDLFFRERKHGIDLYCKRVFVMHNCEELMPEYLRFIRGVADSSDLDLNVSREMLQQNQLVTNMRRNLVKKVLDLLENLEAERYEHFYEAFAPVLKEGIPTDWENRDKLAELLRFKSTKSDGQWISLADYIHHMPKQQTEIYYLTGEKMSTLLNNPALEILREKDYEVLLMTDPVDEFVVQTMTEYKGKPFRSVEKGDLGLERIDTKKREEYSDLFTFIQSVLADQVKEVRVSGRLKGSVVCLAGDPQDISAYMEKILRATGQEVPAGKRILEINIDHPLVTKLDVLLKENRDNPALKDYCRMLYDLAVIGEGGKIENPGHFSRLMGEMMSQALYQQAAKNS
ncbi:MAG: molecular chaperone HtpG [Acidobacteria bacterium]|nr:molecular chaperone HtpG [Acidobacteriota bacterium]